MKYTLHTKILNAALIAAAVIFLQQGQAQNFQQAFGGGSKDNAYGGLPSGDGGYVLFGHTESFGAGSGDYYILKTNSDGLEAWSRTFGSTDNEHRNQEDEHAFNMLNTADGGFLVSAGHTHGFGATKRDLFVVKTDSDGSLMWASKYDVAGQHNFGCYLESTSAGGFLLAGIIDKGLTGTSKQDFMLVKAASDGSVSGSWVYGGAEEDKAFCVIEASDGGYVMAGSTKSYGAGAEDIYIVKTDASGTLQWAGAYGDSASDIGYYVVQSGDGGFLVAAKTASAGAGGTDALLLKLDSDGSMQWSNVYGGSLNEEIYKIVASGTDFLVTGYAKSYGAGDADALLFQVDASGAVLWAKTYGAANKEVGYDLRADGSNFIISGWSESYGAGSKDFYMVRTDANGGCNCNVMTVGSIGTSSVTLIADMTGSSAGVAATASDVTAGVVTSVPATTTTSICVTLPVSLLSFTGEAVDGQYVKLAWNVNGETNIHQYQVERSDDGKIFAPVGQVAARNTGGMYEYGFADVPQSEGINYYRLKVMDHSGEFDYSGLVTVRWAKTSPSLEFTVFPNPNDGSEINIAVNASPDEEVLVVLYNPIGEMVYSKVLLHKNGIISARDMSGKLAPGIYLVEGSSKNEILKQRLVIK